MGKRTGILLASLLCTAHAYAHSESCSVNPGNITNQDIVSIIFKGGSNSSCIPDSSQTSISGQNIYVDLYTSQHFCQQVPRSWSRTVQVGPLAAGNYTVYGRVHGQAPQTIFVPPCPFEVISADAFYIVSAASRKTHGPAGIFDVPITLGVNTFIESRSGGPQTIVIVFNRNIAADWPDPVIASNGTIVSAEAQGDTLLVSLEGVQDGSCLILTVNAVDEFGFPLEGISQIHLRALFGDATQDGSVSVSDMLKAKSLIGVPLTVTNAINDLNLSGSLNVTDQLAAKKRIGNTATCP